MDSVEGVASASDADDCFGVICAGLGTHTSDDDACEQGGRCDRREPPSTSGSFEGAEAVCMISGFGGVLCVHGMSMTAIGG